jgi:phospholipid transport system transporter-binding protein
MPSEGVRREGDALSFSGALTRDAMPALWPQALACLDGARHLDVSAVSEVDSAGLALLAELSDRLGTAEVRGEPAGLADLRGAYRLSASLGYAA